MHSVKFYLLLLSLTWKKLGGLIHDSANKCTLRQLARQKKAMSLIKVLHIVKNLNPNHSELQKSDNQIK